MLSGAGCSKELRESSNAREQFTTVFILLVLFFVWRRTRPRYINRSDIRMITSWF